MYISVMIKYKIHCYFLECEVIAVTFGRSKIDWRIAPATILRTDITGWKECASVACPLPTHQSQKTSTCMMLFQGNAADILYVWYLAHYLLCPKSFLYLHTKHYCRQPPNPTGLKIMKFKPWLIFKFWNRLILFSTDRSGYRQNYNITWDMQQLIKRIQIIKRLQVK